MNLVFSHSLLLNIAVAVLLPMLTALVTKQDAHPGFKAVMLLALSGCAGVLSSAMDAANAHMAFDWGHAVSAAMVAFVWGVLAHLGVLKPIGVTGSRGAIQSKVSGGLG